MTHHYPLDSLLRENVDAFEACVRDIEKALFSSPPPKSSDAMDAQRYRVLRDFDSGKIELAICRWSEHGWVGEWVIEHDPDTAIDAALAAQQTNVNR